MITTVLIQPYLFTALFLIICGPRGMGYMCIYIYIYIYIFYWWKIENNKSEVICLLLPQEMEDRFWGESQDFTIFRLYLKHKRENDF